MNTSFSNNNGNDGNNSFSGTQILSQQGGYLNSSMMSDMAGGENTATRQENRMTPNEPSLLPCTIKQIQTAPLPAKDDGFRIDGKELHNATIVGRIIHINVESTHTSYTIDDGTGQIDVRVWTPSENKSNDENDNSNVNNENNQNNSDLDLKQGIYVRCIGKIKVYQENVNFNGYKIRKIQDFNEITYHNLEAICAHLINQNPNRARNILSQNKRKNVRNNMAKNNNNNNNNNNSSSNNNNGFNRMNNNSNNNNNNNNSNNNNNISNNSGMNGMNNMNNNGGNMKVEEDDRQRSPLEMEILKFLNRCEQENVGNSSYDGCYVDKIFDALQDKDRNEIRELLEQLSTDGTIYSTVDDEHYRTSV